MTDARKEFERIKGKFPTLFASSDGKDTHAFDSIGVGWVPLLEAACETIHCYVTQREVPHFSFAQIKEKFGGLCLYADGGDGFIRGVLEGIEQVSWTMCEECGKPGKRTKQGWIKTLCDEHTESRYTK